MSSYFPWLFARFFVGGIFIAAGFFKLADPIENFRGMITAYGIVPYVFVTPIALILPWLELIGGVFLVLGYFPRWSAVLLGFLSLSFVVLIGVARLVGTLPASCGCFGEHLPMSPYQMMVLDFLNTLLAIRLFQIKTHRLSLTE